MANIIMADSANKLYYSSYMGLCYFENFTPPKLPLGCPSAYKGADKMRSIVCDETKTLGGDSIYRCDASFQDCTALESISLPYIKGIGNSYVQAMFKGCTSLKTATFGSVGHPLTQFANISSGDQIFVGDSNLTITIYVNAETLAEIPNNVTNRQPWGATNATVVYRNSTTGEVISA